MTEKHTNRFTDFTFGFLDDREVRWKRAKNGFDHHGQIIASSNITLLAFLI